MKLKLLLALLLAQMSFSQHRTCGMEQKMQLIMSNPVLKQQFLERQANFEMEYQRLLNDSSNKVASLLAQIKIPVAVHYPSVPNTTSQAEKDCLIALAQSQIDIINADYNAANSDLSNWTGGVSTQYPGVNVGNMGVLFQIATQNHPAGTGLINGMVAVTFGTDFLAGADNDTTWAGYMNFVVRDEGNTILGYSPLGGMPSSGATVVMNTFCFGSGTGCSTSGYVPSAPFNLGRTVTHELGHFFNLNHTFDGCTTSANCATSGDKVCDTPPANAETYNCPAPGSVIQCSGAKVLTMNYMDYVDDPCMYMFTNGQATRMLAYYNTIKTQYSTNVLGVDGLVKNNFSIYPNPNKGSFTIQFDTEIDNCSIQIIDMLGRTVYNQNFNVVSNQQQDIELNSTSIGIFFVKIKNGSSISVQKMIIE